MHTAVVIVPLFSFFMHIGLMFRSFRGLKLLGDTGKADFCVQCRLCQFNKTVWFGFFFLHESVGFSRQLK